MKALTLLAFIIIPFVYISCATGAAKQQSQTRIDHPMDNSSEGVWFQYYHRQMIANDGQVEIPTNNASDEEKNGYRKALDKWHEHKLEEQSEEAGSIVELYWLGYLVGVLLSFALYKNLGV